jgi:uncharacterized protein YegL
MTQPQDVLAMLPEVQAVSSRVLITLVVDTSYSMSQSGRISELNRELLGWREDLLSNDVVRRQGEIALVTFGKDHVRTVDPTGRTSGQPAEAYVPVAAFAPRPLEAGGVTPLVDGLQHAFELIAARRNQLRASGRNMAYRPLVYLITDGVPTDAEGLPSDNWRDIAPVIRQQEDGKHLLFFAFGVDGADEDVLRGLAPNSAHSLGRVPFSRVMQMMSTSIDKSVSAAAHDESAAVLHRQVNEQLDKEERMRRFLEESG